MYMVQIIIQDTMEHGELFKKKKQKKTVKCVMKTKLIQGQ